MRSLVVLAGGAATRLGSRPKGLLEVCGRPIITRVVSELEPLASEVLVSVKDAEQASALAHVLSPNVRFVVDEQRDYAPIVGLAASFSQARYEVVLVAPCDTPFITRRVYERMLALLGDHDAVVPTWGGGMLEPLVAVYRRDKALEAFRRVLTTSYRLTEALQYMDVFYVRVTELTGSPN